jgi:hypothetical protein
MEFPEINIMSLRESLYSSAPEQADPADPLKRREENHQVVRISRFFKNKCCTYTQV